jgi:hypothetical protein
MTMRVLRSSVAVAALIAATLFMGRAPATSAVAPSPHASLNCATAKGFCTEVHDTELVFGEETYIGHDEPSLLFYSNVPGSGNSNLYRLRLPKDPPRLPTQDATGGTFNFQLHPAFWFGMALCDNESAPEFTHTPCTPNSDSNIFDNANSAAADYIGKHPGTAFLELQFYPPGWVPWPAGNSCDATKWCAAMAIFSLSLNQNTGQANNNACLSSVGIEPANFAFITKNGNAHAPANPVDATLDTFTPNPATDLFMNAADELAVDIHDTATGLAVVVHDLTTGASGSMTASIANQFAQVIFEPTATACHVRPYAFHSMYSTSSEHTRVPWAAHSYNVAFSDEIGHFQYCAAVSGEGGACTSSPAGDRTFCFSAAASTRVKVGGCLDTDSDFSGVPYQRTWPGSLANPGDGNVLTPDSVLFSSPLFNGNQRYARVAFEADLPRIELDTNPPCNRATGANCVNPPKGANFYPLYTTRNTDQGCAWQFGGVNIPGTKETFGGTSTAEFGPLLLLVYPGPSGPFSRYNNFRQVLSTNPCN